MECKYKNECEHRFRTLEKAIDSSDKEIYKLRENKEKTNIDINSLCIQVKNLCEKVDDLTATVATLTSKDAENWNKSKWLIVSGIITAIIGFLLGKIGL